MGVSTLHVLEQGPVIASLVRTAVGVLKKNEVTEVPATPGPLLTETVAPRSSALVRDYISHVGGQASFYRGILPPHLFPQWGFPLLSRTLAGLPYDMTKVMNGGCRIEIHQPLPANEPLQLEACLENIDDDGRRAILTERLVTGTKSAERALTCHVYAFVPLAKGSDKDKPNGKPKKKKERPRVPVDARELGRLRLPKNAGLDFALLTGDFNPVHWVVPYARAAGFKRTILHGFSTLARAIEMMNRSLWCSDATQLRVVEVRFTRPLLLPAKVGVFVRGTGELYVGDAPGGPAYLTGEFSTKEMSQ